MADKILFLESVQFRMRRTKDFREKRAWKYPDDPRNLRAAETLDRLSRDNVESISDTQWDDLAPYAANDNLKELIDEVSREIEFKVRVSDFAEYVSLLTQKARSKAA